MRPEFDPDQFRLSPEEIVAVKMEALKKSSTSSSRKPKGEIKFFQFPKDVMYALIRVNYAPVWPLTAAVYKRWYDDFKKRNPVKLTSALLAEFEISKDQKSKGLKLLEQTDWFIVERFQGHNPLVTMKWILIKD